MARVTPVERPSLFDVAHGEGMARQHALQTIQLTIDRESCENTRIGFESMNDSASADRPGQRNCESPVVRPNVDTHSAAGNQRLDGGEISTFVHIEVQRPLNVIA